MIKKTIVIMRNPSIELPDKIKFFFNSSLLLPQNFLISYIYIKNIK